MQALITGGTGLLGRHLIAALHERGDTIRVLALPAEDTTWLAEHGHQVARGDVRERDTLIDAMRGVDTVFHLAGMMGVWRPLEEYYAVNAAGTANVCRAAQVANVRRLVHVSSWTVYGMGRGRVLREGDDLVPVREPYGLTKAEGDRIVQRFIAEERLPAVIVRPDTFFGPGDRVHYGRMADRLSAGKAIVIGSGRNALPFVYVTDVVQGLLLAADQENAVGRAYNIGIDVPLSQEEMLRAIAAAIGAPPPRLHIPYAVLHAVAFAAERAAAIAHSHRPPLVTTLGVKVFGTDNRHAIDRARSELGYAPRVSAREGVERTARWYHQQRQLGPPAGNVGYQHAAN